MAATDYYKVAADEGPLRIHTTMDDVFPFIARRQKSHDAALAAAKRRAREAGATRIVRYAGGKLETEVRL